MLLGGGHSGVTGINGAGVVSWWSHFKVVSVGHAGARGTWRELEQRCQWSHPQTGIVCDGQETLDNGGIHCARSKHGGHRQGHWDLSGQNAPSGRQTGAQQAGVVSGVSLSGVSGAIVRHRQTIGTRLAQTRSLWLTVAQSVVCRTGGPVEPDRQGSCWGHTGPKGQVSHTLAERSVSGTLGHGQWGPHR